MTNTHNKSPMDKLDLDSFLNSHSDDDDDEDPSIPHRSLEEILNDSDSSSATSPPLSPHHTRFSSLQNDTVSQNSNSVTRVNSSALLLSSSTDFSRRQSLPPPPPPHSKPLPSLFGGVRSNAKPGDALAAAAKASRPVPTPHAAAIKSRRARVLERGVDDQDNVSNSVSVSSNEELNVIVGTERTDSGEFVSAVEDEILDNRDRNLDEFSVSNVNFDFNNATDSSSDLVFETGIELNKEGSEKIEGSVIVAAENESEFLDLDETNEIAAEEKIEEDMSQEAENLEEVTRSENDDSSSDSEISEIVEERIGQLESEISKRAEKKLKVSKKPLELAEELEKKQASTGLHWEEGAAAQPMRLEGVRRGSTTLGYFNTDANNVVTGTISSQAFRRDHGSPQVLAVHLNYVAVGMSKGVIVVFPSKYSPHTTDNMDAKMLMLGLHGDRSHAPVTSMCFNQQGDLLLAGYGDGHITLWDIQRGAAAKVITGEHSAPVVHVLFLGQDSQVTRQFKAVTGDNKGLVLLHTISVFPLFNRFTIKSQCLLDGQRTGIVVSVSPLLFDELSGDTLPSSQGNTLVPSSGIGSMVGGVVGGDAGWKLFNEGSSLVEEGVVIFVTHQNALVVRLSPTLEVYAQLSRPDGVREGSMPYTAWKCTTQSHGSSANIPGDSVERVSLLALAWDRKVQVAKLVKSELKVYGKWSLDSPAIGVAWLDSHMLVILTLTGHLYLFAKDGSIIHQTSFAIDNFGGDDLAAYHTHFTNVYGNPEKAYNNCVAVRGASIYILGPGRLVVSRLLPWKERIQVLRLAGDWMGALNMAMTLYDGQAHGILDLPSSIEALQEIIMPYLVELLLSYVDEVFSYISVAFCNQIGKVEQQDDSNSGTSPVQSEIKEQYTRVGGVAVEFCVHIRRTDLLFDEIFSKFIAVQHRDTFLELLEPYILKDMLGSLPPEIMQALVEHYSRKGWLQRVEQCVLHMDISSLDFNQVVRICREHGLYGALVYLFNKGLGDFRTPLEELLAVSQKSQQESAYALGYRTLVYLKYCFSGLSFPPGHGVLPPDQLPSIRTELVQFLLESSPVATSQVSSSSPYRGKYLNLFHLLELDTEATLDVLRYAFMDDETLLPDVSLHDDANANLMANQDNNAVAGTRNLLVQNTIDALVQILENDMSQSNEYVNNDTSGSVEAWPTEKDLGHLFEFVAYYVAHGKSYVSNSMLAHILEYLTSECNHPPSVSVETSKIREKQVLSLLEVVPETEWNASYVLQLCEKANFHQVCGLIYTFRYQYVTALESYMKDMNEPIHTFSYIDHLLQCLSGNALDAFRSAVMSRIPELVILSREGTFFLIVDQFNKEIPHILSELHSQPKSLFLYLKTVIEVHLSGTLDFSNLRKDDSMKLFNARKLKDQSKELASYLERISDFPKLVRNYPINVTDDMIELYLELLCQYERDSVLKFLERFDSYRVEHCLRLCQEYGITDAAAFLLERVGDVGNALLLTLSSLNGKFIELDKAVLNVVSNKGFRSLSSIDQYITVSKIKEVNEIRSTLNACIVLCQRNTPRLEPEESETLWFRLLDSFCEPLMDAYVKEEVLKEANHGILAETFGSHEEDEACVIKWKILKSHKGAHILRKLISQFIKEIVEGMIGYVRLPTIMSKLLSENGSQEFGDFKVTILGMLGTYGFERRILDTAKSLIEDDTFYTLSLLKKGASHGYAPRNPVCCICNCDLTKNSSSFRIRVFSCGHATHLECEHLESESSSGGPLYGCPVCMPKKSTHRPKDKSAFPYDSLVKKASSRPHRSHKSGVLHQYEDLLDNSHGFQQIPRFEMLTNLQKEQRIIQIENMPQLRLAPPAVYHEKKVKKRPELLAGESSSDQGNAQKGNRSRQLRDLKVKGSSLRFPLKSSIFGKEKANKE